MSSPRSLPSAVIGTIALLLLTSPAAAVSLDLRVEGLGGRLAGLAWTVRAEVGEGTSADVLYTIER